MWSRNYNKHVHTSARARQNAIMIIILMLYYVMYVLSRAFFLFIWMINFVT